MNLSIGRIIIAAIMAGAIGARTQDEAALVVRNVNVADPGRDEILTDQTVVIRQGRILLINDAANVAVTGLEHAVVVDGAGKWLIPGLWDMHVHVGGAGDAVAMLMAAHGVTHVRDMGGDLLAVRDLRQRIDRGALTGPQIITAGPILEDRRWLERAKQTMPGGLSHRIPVGSPLEARAVVDMVADMGVDFIKTRNVTSAEVFDALIDAAKARGLYVAGHEPMTVSLAEAARLGQRSFEHLPFLSLTLPGQEAGDDQIEKTAATLAIQGAYVTPTLISTRLRNHKVAEMRGWLEGGDPRMAWISKSAREAWKAQLEDMAGEEGGLDWPSMISRSHDILKRMRAAGVPVLAGTDLGVAFVFPGAGLHDELALLVEQAGLTPREALAAATLNPARLAGLAKREGAVRPGMNANLALLDGDPFADIANVRKIHAVILRGRLLDRAALDRLIERAIAEKDAEPGGLAFVAARQAACDKQPTADCAGALGLHLFAKGDYVEAAERFDQARDLADDDAPRYAEAALEARIDALHEGAIGCQALHDALAAALAGHEDDANARMAILARALDVLAKKDCADGLTRYLPALAAIEADGLKPLERAARDRHIAEYWLRVANDPERAFKQRVANLPADWEQNPLALRELAQWCLDRKLMLPKAREFAARSAELAEAALQKGRSLLLEAAVLDAMDRPAEAAATIERILAQFNNDFLRNLHKKYQDRAAALADEP